MIKLLISEDHQSLLDGLLLLFKGDKEIEVIGFARDGKELLEILEHKKPDVLLTDINMPRMNGIELCEKVMASNSSIKIVAFSMFENEDAIKDMLGAGAMGYVLKQRPLAEVRKAILSVSRGERYFDASIDLSSIENSEKSKQKTLLSPSEREILKLIAQGKNSSEIAELRCTASSTVLKHRKNIIQKLGLHGKGELLRYALNKYKHY